MSSRRFHQILSFLRSKGKTHLDLENLAQDIWFEEWISQRQLSQSEIYFRFIDLLRSHKTEELQESNTPSAPLSQNEFESLFHHLKKLNLKNQILIFEHFWQNKPLSPVEQHRLHEVLNILRKKL